MHRNPSHLGSYTTPAGRRQLRDSLASIGFTGGMTGRSTPPLKRSTPPLDAARIMGTGRRAMRPIRAPPTASSCTPASPSTTPPPSRTTWPTWASATSTVADPPGGPRQHPRLRRRRPLPPQRRARRRGRPTTGSPRRWPAAAWARSLDIVPNHMAIAERPTPGGGTSSRTARPAGGRPPSTSTGTPPAGSPAGPAARSSATTTAGCWRRASSRSSATAAASSIRYFDHARAGLAPQPRRAAARRRPRRPVPTSWPAWPWPSAGCRPPAPPTTRASTERHRDKEVLRGRLARLLDENPRLAAAVDAAVAASTPTPTPSTPSSSARTTASPSGGSAGQELDYRRFFDVNTLVGLRMEDGGCSTPPTPWCSSWCGGPGRRAARRPHRRPARPGRLLAAARAAAGRHLRRGREDPGARTRPSRRLAGGGHHRLRLPQRGRRPVRRPRRRGAAHRALPGAHRRRRSPELDDVVAEGKNLVLREVLGADINRLVNLLVSVCERHRRHRDSPAATCTRRCGRSLAASPSTAPTSGPGDGRRTRTWPPSTTAVAGPPPPARHRPGAVRLPGRPAPAAGAGRAREPTSPCGSSRSRGPVMAKGVEDTAFYRYNRLSPQRGRRRPRPVRHVGRRVPRPQRAGRRDWPATMLATSTHDTKRSEDVRARIGLLSEIPVSGRRRSPVDHHERPPSVDAAHRNG